MPVVLKKRLVTYPVLTTVAAEVAALLNSRPLTHLSGDPDDPGPLTPNHFLHGGARLYSPLKFTTNTIQTIEQQFQHNQEIVEQFWRRLLEMFRHLLQEGNGARKFSPSQWVTLSSSLMN